MTLHPALGTNRFCGPGALAMVTGRSTGEAAAAIRTVTGKRAVFGVTVRALVEAADHLGVRLVPVLDAPAEMPLVKVATMLPAGLYVAHVTGHYIAVAVAADGAVEAGDNQSVYGRPVAQFPRARKRLRHPLASRHFGEFTWLRRIRPPSRWGASAAVPDRGPKPRPADGTGPAR